jgi:hypothetical protein
MADGQGPCGGDQPVLQLTISVPWDGHPYPTMIGGN